MSAANITPIDFRQMFLFEQFSARQEISQTQAKITAVYESIILDIVESGFLARNGYSPYQIFKTQLKKDYNFAIIVQDPLFLEAIALTQLKCRRITNELSSDHEETRQIFAQIIDALDGLRNLVNFVV